MALGMLNNKIPIYPIFYVLRGDYRVEALGFKVSDALNHKPQTPNPKNKAALRLCHSAKILP